MCRASNSKTSFTVAPRLSLRWQPDKSGRFVVFGGYSRYAQPLPLDYFAYGDPAAAAGRVFRWNDNNGDHVFQDGERGPLIAAVGPCCAGSVPNGIDPGIGRPLTDELLTGVETRVGPWSVGFSGVDRRIRHLVASVDTGVSQGNYILKYIPDIDEDFLDASDDRLLAVYDRNPASFGQDRYLLTNPAGQDTRYQGLELTVERHGVSRWRTRFDGAAYRSDAIGGNRGFRVLENDPGIVGEVFENPNAGTYARGREFFDRGYVAKWWNTYLAPRDWAVTTVVRYQDGQPFARIVVVPDLNQGAEAIQAYNRGRTRFTFTLTLDAHSREVISDSWSQAERAARDLQPAEQQRGGRGRRADEPGVPTHDGRPATARRADRSSSGVLTSGLPARRPAVTITLLPRAHIPVSTWWPHRGRRGEQ
jgi:hypothetical protein